MSRVQPHRNASGKTQCLERNEREGKRELGRESRGRVDRVCGIGKGESSVGQWWWAWMDDLCSIDPLLTPWVLLLSTILIAGYLFYLWMWICTRLTPAWTYSQYDTCPYLIAVFV